jgi:hypothetical protein
MTDVYGKNIDIGDYLILTRITKGGPGLASPSEQTKVKVLNLNKEEIHLQGLYSDPTSMTFRINYLQTNCVIRKFEHL